MASNHDIILKGGWNRITLHLLPTTVNLIHLPKIFRRGELRKAIIYDVQKLGGSWTLSWHQPNREEEKGQNSMTHRLIDTFSLFFCWLETIVRVKCVTERTALLHTPAPPSSLSESPIFAERFLYFIFNFSLSL